MTLSRLSVGSFELEPPFNKSIHDYTVNCGTPHVGANPVEVTFETSDPSATATATYQYQGGGGAVPIYIWDDPPYVFDAWDCPGLIVVSVTHGTQTTGYRIHTRNSYTP